MVYLDRVVLLNLLVDYLLLLTTARLAGIPLRRGRYALCGLLGGLYAGAVFLPGWGFLAAAPVKIAAGVLLALTAFGGERHFLRLTLLTFAIACGLAGTVLAFARALGEYGATSMIAGYTPGKTATISTTVYQLWRTDNDALAFKWVLVNVAISAVVLLAVNLLEKKQRRSAGR